ncbi:hypothetical protein NCC49_003968 [Naganishia albida]|nr:hypothetical protein NCC49_003968 [Naganishia albida]
MSSRDDIQGPSDDSFGFNLLSPHSPASQAPERFTEAEFADIWPAQYAEIMQNQQREDDGIGPDADMDVGPVNPQSRATVLVQRFREEVYRDWVDGQMARYNLRGAVSAYELNIADLQEAVRARGQDGSMPYASMVNIRRHDWNRAANCMHLHDRDRRQTVPRQRGKS